MMQVLLFRELVDKDGSCSLLSVQQQYGWRVVLSQPANVRLALRRALAACVRDRRASVTSL